MSPTRVCGSRTPAYLCGRRRRGGGPLAAVPSPAARRAPAAAATAAQIENFCEKFFENSLSTKCRRYSILRLACRREPCAGCELCVPSCEFSACVLACMHALSGLQKLLLQNYRGLKNVTSLLWWRGLVSNLSSENETENANLHLLHRRATELADG